MAAKVMAVFWLAQLAKTKPAQTQGGDSVFRKVDAAFLLIFREVSVRVMAHEVENGWSASREHIRFVKKCGGLHSRENLVAEFAYAIAMGRFNYTGVFKMRCSPHPFLRPPV